PYVYTKAVRVSGRRLEVNIEAGPSGAVRVSLHKPYAAPKDRGAEVIGGLSSHTIAEDRTFKLQFNETEVLQLPDGRILAMMRCHKFRDHVGNYLFQSYSQDGGVTWTPFKKTPIWGYPPQLILCKSGAVLCTYAHRRHPYGVRACLSRDLGETWDYENEKIIRD